MPLYCLHHHLTPNPIACEQMSSIPNQPKIDVSVDEDFGAHSVSQIIGRRRNKASAKKQQPWEHSYVVNPADVPSSTSLHDKPWFTVETLEAAYDDHSGS